MSKGKTTLIQKDPSKGTDPNKYRPITCLPMMWKIQTAQIREKKSTIRLIQAADCTLTNRKDAAKDPEAQHNYSS